MAEATEVVGGLDVAVDAISVGVRHRKDVGDLEALASSIEQLGLLQPITITPGRVLVCGWRRLEAVKLLGWTQVRAWVRSGLSDDAARLLAEHDENVLRQAYTKVEQAALYREFKEVLSQEAKQRQAATQFGAEASETTNSSDDDAMAAKSGDSNIPGSVDSTSPDETSETLSTRDRAALLATGKKSWQAMERIGTLMDYSVDPSLPDDVRELAAEAVLRIEDGGQVAPDWERVQAALGFVPDQDDDAPDSAASTHDSEPAPRVSLYALRVWATTWEGIARLLYEHDPLVLGPALPVKDWDTLCDVQRRLAEMVEAMRQARQEAATAHADDATGGEEEGAIIAPTGAADGDEPTQDAERPDGAGDQPARGAERPDDAAEGGLAQVVPLGARS
ncbi:ParB/RepB/Spo0J family partition protein [Myceligenerans xiligouense]|uniref:ParB/RepB/Spo0J family partition protein n=1 Tax=Myceligenerans xiligouense TaxID=253184 RepID=A0A3N4YQ20_9MICO|nr:ParB/RepB/Spo0J family partition protein [Myceligenerans xiligouense]